MKPKSKSSTSLPKEERPVRHLGFVIYCEKGFLAGLDASTFVQNLDNEDILSFANYDTAKRFSNRLTIPHKIQSVEAIMTATDVGTYH